MKILLLSRYDRTGASSRLRSYQYIPMLKRFGIDVHVAPLLSEHYIRRLFAGQPTHWGEVLGSYLRRVSHILKAKSYDLLWIEKELFPNLPAWFEAALFRRRISYVVDYDDAIFDRYRFSQNPFKKLLARKIDSVMRNASIVICGNKYLAEHALLVSARRVEIIPTVVDIGRYSTARHVSNDRIVIVWIGTPTTAKYIDIAAPALRLAAKEYPLQLRVIGAHFRATGLDVECRAWSEESEVQEVQECTIGIMPLADTPWERGKCGYKLVQYMACGLPVIASPVGMNKELVTEGVNGFLPSNEEEWLSANLILFRDQQFRMKKGELGRNLVVIR
jgi:glycosyltransferase involved in cell wall biosynthesis